MIERAARIANECYAAGLATLRSGAAFAEVSEAMLAPAETAGAWFRGPQIHGLNPYGAFSRIPGGLIQAAGGDRYPIAGPRPAKGVSVAALSITEEDRDPLALLGANPSREILLPSGTRLWLTSLDKLTVLTAA